MRLLHHLDGRVPIWPMDPLPGRGSAVVEIYTRIYIRNAGHDRTQDAHPRRAQPGARGLGSPPARLRFEPNDHQTDALVTAAAECARSPPGAPRLRPAGLTPEIARTEGWTFGVL